MAVIPVAQSIQAGSSRQWSLVVTPLNGFHSTVNITLSGLPSGITGPASVALVPSVPGTITLIAADSATVSSSPIVIQGKSGALVHTIQLMLAVTAPADFSLAAGSPSLTLQAGGASQSIPFTLTAIDGFSSPVTVTLSGVPLGVSASPASLSLTPGAGESILFNAQNAAAAGPYTMTVTGTSGSLTHSVSLALAVTPAADFTVSPSPVNLTLQAGNATQFSVSAAALNGFNLPISVATSGLPSGVIASPSAFSLLPGASQAIQLTSTGNATVGNSNVTLTASAGSLTHSAAIAVFIQPQLTINVYPASFDLAPGLSQTLTVSAADGSTGPQSIAVTLQGLPAGIQATPASLSLVPGVAQNVVVTADNTFIADGYGSLQASVDGLAQTQQLAFHALPEVTTMVTNGLMAYFPMNEGQGTAVHDTSGGGYAGTFGGSGNSWTSGGVSFSGSGWIDLTTGLTTAQTIQMWVDAPAGPAAAVQTLIGTAGNAGVDTFLWALSGQSMLLDYSTYNGAISATPFNGSGVVALVEGNSYTNRDQYWIDDAQVYDMGTYWSPVKTSSSSWVTPLPSGWVPPNLSAAF